MNKCDCWHKEERIVGWCGFSPLTKTVYECYGTKEREECHCMGDRGKCDFYQGVREKAMKDNGCEYCKYETEIMNLYEYSSWDGGVGYDYVETNFCPKCGRDLRKGENNGTCPM